jgi:hypothetical protein
MTATKRFATTGLLGLMLTMAGCSHSKPTSSDGEDVAKRILVKNCKADTIDITDFTKTDGTLAERDGVKTYILEYEAVGKTKVNLWVDGIPKLPQMDPIPFDALKATTEKDKLPTAVPAGTEIKFRGAFIFHQSENGWRAEEATDRDKDGKVIYY